MNTITPDNAEVSARALTQADEALAGQINDRHHALMAGNEDLAERVQYQCSEAISIARLVETAHSHLGGKRFATWWRDHNLPVGWAEKYMTLARTAHRHTLGDKDQLRLIGVLPDAETREGGQAQQGGQSSSSFEWYRYAGKLRASFSVDRISSMGDADKRAAMQQLEPIKKLINALEASIGV